MRYVAFLRAINVGGRNVKMDVLSEQFASLGLTGVETFIASGNVIFGTRSNSPAALERRIEKCLLETLGYEVATFLRTDAEVAKIVQYQAFNAADCVSAGAYCVGFMAAPAGREAEKRLMALSSPIDDFQLRGREVYWLCKKKQSESAFSNAVFEKALGIRATFRGMNTLRKLASRFAPAGQGARKSRTLFLQTLLPERRLG